MTDILVDIAVRLYEGDAPGVAQHTREAIDKGVSASDILNRALLPAMDRVGREFKEGDLFIPEVIVAARAMHAALELLKPLLAGAHAGPSRKIALGTVKGDLHDIGKKLVGFMMQGAGFDVIDLGYDVPPERFVEVVRHDRPDLIGLSALLSTTMPMMKATINALHQAGVRRQVRVIVGGAPVTQEWANAIGADGYAPDAVSAVECAEALFRQASPRS